jgi:DNA-binding transcriptional MerR regulator
MKMEIKEFSDKTDITIDTLRYYDKIGLLVPPKVKGRRSYSEGELEMAMIIKKLKSLDFSLDEIKALFELEKDVEQDKALNDESISKINSCLEMIIQKYNIIIKQEQDLIQVKKALKKMIDKTNKLLELRHFYTE